MDDIVGVEMGVAVRSVEQLSSSSDKKESAADILDPMFAVQKWARWCLEMGRGCLEMGRG